MGIRTKITVFFQNMIDGNMEHVVFETDSINIDNLISILNEQDIERLTRLMTDNHNLKQSILFLERENRLLKNNSGILVNKLIESTKKD